MDLNGGIAVVTGGASGLGFATASLLVERGNKVVILDLPERAADEKIKRLGALANFHPVDIRDAGQVEAGFEAAAALGAVRALVHCAGMGGKLRRLLDADGNPDPQGVTNFEAVVQVNLVGSFNVLRAAAARMVLNPPCDGERGVCVMTSSIAAFEGQVGQVAYSASKAGINGMTLVAARDLADHQIRVCTIAPGLFDTAMLAGVPAEARTGMERSIPHPRRVGDPREFAKLALHIIDNPMINGEVIRIDAANRLPSGIG